MSVGILPRSADVLVIVWGKYEAVESQVSTCGNQSGGPVLRLFINSRAVSHLPSLRTRTEACDDVDKAWSSDPVTVFGREESGSIEALVT